MQKSAKYYNWKWVHLPQKSFSDSTVLNYQEVKIKLFGMIGTSPGDKWF